MAKYSEDVEGLCRRRRGREGRDLRRAGRAFLRDGRAVRLRQVHAAAHDRGRRDDHVGRNPHRRARRQRHRAVRARHRDGVPELRALSAHERLRQHGVRPAQPQNAEARDREARARSRAHPGNRAVARPQAAPALRRPAPARRDGPRDRAAAEGLPVRRAALESRRQAARLDARRDPQAAEGARHDLDLRHARPARGDDARRHAGGDERRQASSRSARRSRSTRSPRPRSSRPSSARPR